MIEIDGVYWVAENDTGITDMSDPFSGLDEAKLPRLLRDFETWQLDMRIVELREGKAIGSSKARTGTRDSIFLSRLKSSPNYQKNLKTEKSKGRKEFDRLLKEARRELRVLLDQYHDKTLSFAALQRDSVDWFTFFYKKMYEAGRRASGLGIYVPEKAKPTKGEMTWLKSATNEELKYWKKFLTEIKEGKAVFQKDMDAQTLMLSPPRRKYTIEERMNMYLESMDAVFENGRVSGMPDNLLYYWIGPKVGEKGICLTDSACMVDTNRGKIALDDVVVGDLVLTHESRWKRVSAKYINRATAQHRYAVVVGSDFRLFGVTQDHEVWTNAGWLTAKDAARKETDLLDFTVGVFQEAPSGREVHSDLLGRYEDAPSPTLPMGVGESLWADTRRLCDTPQKREACRRPFGKPDNFESYGASSAPCEQSTQGCSKEKSASHLRNVQEKIQSAGGAEVDELFRCVSNTMVEEEEKTKCLSSVQEGVSCQSVCSQNKEVLLSEVLSKNTEGGDHSDPAVRMLWEELQTQKRPNQVVHEGQVILLSGVLPIDSPLYDISVEEDHSFVVEGRAVHNCAGCAYIVDHQPYPKSRLPAVPRSGATPCLSRCRHKLLARKATPKEIAQREAVLPKKVTLTETLTSIVKSRGRVRPRGAKAYPWVVKG